VFEGVAADELQGCIDLLIEELGQSAEGIKNQQTDDVGQIIFRKFVHQKNQRNQNQGQELHDPV
jgi:hypothetical protein